MGARRYVQVLPAEHPHRLNVEDDLRFPSTPDPIRNGRFSLYWIPMHGWSIPGFAFWTSAHCYLLSIGNPSLPPTWSVIVVPQTSKVEVWTGPPYGAGGVLRVQTAALPIAVGQEVALELDAVAGSIKVSGLASGNATYVGTAWNGAVSDAPFRLGGSVLGAGTPAHGYVSLPYAQYADLGTVPAPTPPEETALTCFTDVRLFYRPDAEFCSLNGAVVASVLNRGTMGGSMTAPALANRGSLITSTSWAKSAPLLSLDGVDDYYTLPDLSSLTQGEMALIGRKRADPAASDSKSGAYNLGTEAGSHTHLPFTDGVIYDDFGTTLRKTVGNPSASLAAPFCYQALSGAGAWQAFVNDVSMGNPVANTVGFPVAPVFGLSPGPPARYYDGELGELVLLGSVQNAYRRARYAAARVARYGF